MKLARVSVANDDLRPQMSCVCLDVYHDKIIVVSSDGHSLYKETVNLGLGTKWLDYGEFPADGSARLLAHKSKLQALDNAFRGLNQITVTADTSMLQFSADGVCLVFRQVDQKYPNYDSVIPKNPPHRLVCDRRDLVAALRRVSLFGDDSSNLVRLSVVDGALMLQADDYDFSKSASEKVALSECQCQDGFAIGCKCAMFIALLGCIQTDSVVLLFTDPTRAFLMREADEANSSRVCLQMPMLLNS
jgi:DNA polymerase-3 subunit beta